MTATTKTKTCPTWCDWQHHGNDLEDPKAVGHSHTVLGVATGDHFAGVAHQSPIRRDRRGGSPRRPRWRRLKPGNQVLRWPGPRSTQAWKERVSARSPVA